MGGCRADRRHPLELRRSGHPQRQLHLSGTGGGQRRQHRQLSPARSLHLYTGGSVINGTNGADTLNGTNGDDTINGLGGNDTIKGLEGNDIIEGGSGNDTVNGGLGSDTFKGFVGTDTVNGGGGADTGTDTIVLTATSTSLNSATNAQITYIEAISAAAALSAVTLNLGNQGEGFGITGSASNDTITGGSGADTINAGAGDDRINGFVGADMVNGGDGTDTIVLTATSSSLNNATEDQITSVEAVLVSGATTSVTINLGNQSEGFLITGGNVNNTITGGAGNDTINAGGQNDTINGFVGADTVNGGGGTDTIVLKATSADFNSATDAQIVNVEAISAASAATGRHPQSR